MIFVFNYEFMKFLLTELLLSSSIFQDNRPSEAQTLMTRSHGCFELVFESLRKISIAADLG